MRKPATIIIDDSTGQAVGVPLPNDVAEAMTTAGLGINAPTRSNGYADATQSNNGNTGNATTPGTLAANITQEQWFANVATEVVLPRFAADGKPFVLVFWSRDPDGTQHNQGDSLQTLAPGINGPTAIKSLRNADDRLKQLLDWLDQHPAIKANTDVVLTSDHGFATISRREVEPHATTATEPSAALNYVASKEKTEPVGTLPTGFLGIDLGLYLHLHVFDPTIRATAGDSVYAEVALDGDAAQFPAYGSALLGDRITRLDGSDAQLLIAGNGGADLIYAPGHDAALVHRTLDTLASFDYIGGIFVDDSYCPSPTDCGGALPFSSIGLKGSTRLPAPAIVVAFKVFNRVPADLQTAVQISDTTLQEGQGMHGGLGRDSTWNNMAAIGPDFKRGFVDEAPMGNIDIAPTIASLLGIAMPSIGTLRGRVVSESLTAGSKTSSENKVVVSIPAANGKKTVLEFQQANGVSYYDRACFLEAKSKSSCSD